MQNDKEEINKIYRNYVIKKIVYVFIIEAINLVLGFLMLIGAFYFFRYIFQALGVI